MINQRVPAGTNKDQLLNVFLNQRAQLIAIAFKVVGNAAMAEEITQEAYFRICDGNCSANIRNVKSYCMQIVRNLALDTYRKYARQCEYTSQDDALDAQHVQHAPAPWHSPEQRFYFQEVLSAVIKVLNCVPERQRRAFVLTYLENMTQREVATELGCSAASVNTYLRKARQALMRCDICRTYTQGMPVQ